MKKIFLALLIISTGMYAQKPAKGMKGNKNQHHEKIKALKTAHITQELDLTSSEAEKFWPIYNAFDAKLMALRKNGNQETKQKIRANGIDSLSDEEANAIIDKMIATKSKTLAYRIQLVSDLRNVIPPIKIIKLQRAEESFKRMLLKQLQQKHGRK